MSDEVFLRKLTLAVLRGWTNFDDEHLTGKNYQAAYEAAKQVVESTKKK